MHGIRAELDEAMAEGVGNNVQFEVGPVELEFAVDIQKDAKADFGVRIWVLSLGAKGGAGLGSTNRIKVVLNPKDEHDSEFARIRECLKHALRWRGDINLADDRILIRSDHY